MVVLVLSACPAGLRGHLTRWFLEVSPGVFVGVVNTRVRDLAWERVVDLCKDGRAIMIHSARGEQRLAFKVHRHEWEPIDIDGIHLMRRPHTGDSRPGGPRAGWSKQAATVDPIGVGRAMAKVNEKLGYSVYHTRSGSVLPAPAGMSPSS